MTSRSSHSAAATRAADDRLRRRSLKFSLLALIALMWSSGLVFADDEEEVTVAHAAANFGEPKYPADFDHLDYVNPEAPKGGEISFWSQGNFDSFNIYTRRGVAGALTSVMYESILANTADDAYGIYCYLCTTMEFPESRDWVIFNLRDDVTFSDGSPMTAEDIKFTFELFMEQGITEYRTVVEGFVSEVEVLDTHRIKFTFTDEAPRRDVLSFAGGTTVFSKAWFEETGARIDESTLVPFLGTGPYVVERFDVGRQIVYGRNPNFWGAEHPLNVGQNNFDRLRVEYFADSSAALQAFSAGVYTFRNENSSRDWATGYTFPAVRQGHVRVEELPNGNIGSAQAFVFNLRKPEWQDPDVREAVRMMFNFEWSNETLFFGSYARVNSFWENSDLEATGVPSEGERALLSPLVEEGLLAEAILTDEAILAPENVAAENLPSRAVRREAGRLLDEAGWELGEGGFRTRDGRRLTMTILQSSPSFDRIVNPYVENLRQIGIDAQLDRVDIAQYVDRRRTGDYDLVNHTFSMGFEPGIGLRQWFASETAEDSSRNLMGLQNAAVDRLVTHVIDARSLEEMTTAVHALDRVLRSIGFWVPQWYKDTHWVAYYDMYRYPENLPPFALGETSFWWFDADAADRLRQAGAIR